MASGWGHLVVSEMVCWCLCEECSFLVLASLRCHQHRLKQWESRCLSKLLCMGESVVAETQDFNRGWCGWVGGRWGWKSRGIAASKQSQTSESHRSKLIAVAAITADASAVANAEDAGTDADAAANQTQTRRRHRVY